MDNKTKISADKARALVLDFNDLKLLDRISNAINDFFGEEVYQVYLDNEVVVEDGAPYKELDPAQWYDEIYEEFVSKCYGVIKKDIN